ncbi:MAG: outer membrane protein assembly factor BamD [Candidatus Cloacimonadaceae bacterium]|nr:outer membrane protein assembly factor BamD [Candidatus Cloacimonadaceae bacterium]
MKKTIYLMFILLILIAGCSKNKVQLTTDQKLQKADELFSAKKYARAAQLYEEISFERKSAATARALMRQGDSYFNINKFVDARLRYSQFTQMFPDHPEVSNAFFRIAVCFFEESLPPQYDQFETKQSIDAFKVFVDKFPADSRFNDALEYIRKAQYKLLEKKFHNGYIHYMMKDYSGALMYFTEITELGNRDQLDKMSLYYSVIIHHKQGADNDAKEFYERIKLKYPGSKETRKLARRIR